MASLEELCLKSICKRFSGHMQVFNSTEDAQLKKHLHFLQRVYSQYLLDHFTYIGELGNQHIEFLLNKHLKKLNLAELLHKGSTKMILDRISEFAPNLEKLSYVTTFNGAIEEQNRYALNKLLKNAPCITNVCIPFICNDETLTIIATSCPRLTHLCIRKSLAVTELGLQALCYYADAKISSRCPLRKLDLRNTRATTKDVSFLLINIPTLEELKYEHMPKVFYLTYKSSLKNKLPTESKTFNLTSIDFCSANHSDNVALLPLCANVCPHIKELKMNVCQWHELYLCSLFWSLNSLYIRNFKYLSNSLDNFLRTYGAKLKHISVYYFSLSVSTLITSCPNLESVDLMGIDCLPIKENELPDLNHLHSLQFDSTRRTDDSIRVKSLEILLNSSPNLERLTFPEFDPTNSELVTVLDKYLKNSRLKHLCFTYGPVQMDFLKQIILSSKTLLSLSFGSGLDAYSDLQWPYELIMASNSLQKITYLNEMKVFSKEFPSGLLPYISTWSRDFGDEDIYHIFYTGGLSDSDEN